MSDQNTEKRKNPRLLDILKEDLRNKGYLGARHREWRELQEFYLTENQKDELKKMKSGKRLLWKIGWILKSMFLKLSPFRRVLVIIALILMFAGPTIATRNNDEDFSFRFPVSSILLITVIMLELKDKLLARDELEAGRRIQHALMPEQNPRVDGWDVMLFTRSANEVGGDLVDFLKIESGRFGITLADISGKGLHAALLMSKLQATIRALASAEIPIGKLVSRVNDIFHRDTPPSIFASLLYIELIPSSDELRFINAGHLPPLIFQKDELCEISKGELGLGLKSGTEYHDRTERMTTNDVFIGYSDGITEARNAMGEFYGLERFKKLLPPLMKLDAEHIGKEILKDIEKFVGDTSMNDDLSLVILKHG